MYYNYSHPITKEKPLFLNLHCQRNPKKQAIIRILHPHPKPLALGDRPRAPGPVELASSASGRCLGGVPSRENRLMLSESLSDGELAGGGGDGEPAVRGWRTLAGRDGPLLDLHLRGRRRALPVAHVPELRAPEAEAAQRVLPQMPCAAGAALQTVAGALPRRLRPRPGRARLHRL